MALQTQDSDVLEALREHSRLFLKLDFAYIAAGGAIITALKIGKSDLIEFGATIDPIVIALVFVSLIDVIIFSLVFGSWLSLKIKSVKRTDTRGLETLLKIQPFMHFAFVSFLLIGATSFASGSFDQLTELKHQAELQEAVDSFMQANGKPPASLKQLKAALPKSVPTNFNDKNVHIVTTGVKSYKLVFPGSDGVFGTTDDDIATQELPLKLVIEALEADGRK